MLYLEVPGKVFVTVLQQEMGKELVEAIRKFFGAEVRLNWVLSANLDPNAHAGKAAVAPAQESYTPQQNAALPELDAHLDANYTFDNFCPGESNRVALTIAKSIAQDPDKQTFNPFFLYGASGVGKTHLVTAVGMAVKERFPARRVLFVTADQFRKQYTESVVKNKTNDFVYFYQSIDLLIIDDFQEIRTPKTQQAFFHIFNHLQANNRKILITSDRAPAEFEGIEERMLSRLKWGVSVELERPDAKLRRAILDALLRRFQMTFPEDVLQYIVEHVSDNVRELHGTLNSMIAFSCNDSANADIDLDLARRCAARVVNQTRRELTLDIILAAVCQYFKVKPAEVHSKSRKQHHVAARHLTMYLTHKYTDTSLSQIGRALGGRDHSTVLHGCTRLERKLMTDKQFRREIEELEASLKK